jgi:putative FmdB family regulatory protein
MPIYAYRCASCGHAKDVLQKISDPQLTVCPVCGAESFQKQLTAAGFQLKGSGWYVTDFRGGDSGKPGEAAKAEGKSDAKTEAKPTEAGSAAAPASAPAASAAPSPAPATKSVAAPAPSSGA